ncbi:hypothetical protein DPEC_G00142500 [Dallia pectoralis]|uniref:Uncharacterized protein n=1 Tax=Dallia pectoralis TaxID=75939 RepID=A0ACC2GMT2_DALPE|nr:hypothetical protein DPEC_G00142500 [Dallia pectoralis]
MVTEPRGENRMTTEEVSREQRALAVTFGEAVDRSKRGRKRSHPFNETGFQHLHLLDRADGHLESSQDVTVMIRISSSLR